MTIGLCHLPVWGQPRSVVQFTTVVTWWRRKDYSMSFTSMLHKTRHADYIGLSNFKLLGCSKDKCLCWFCALAAHCHAKHFCFCIYLQKKRYCCKMKSGKIMTHSSWWKSSMFSVMQSKKYAIVHSPQQPVVQRCPLQHPSRPRREPHHQLHPGHIKQS